MTNSKRRLIYLLVYLAYTTIYISRVSMSVAETELEALSVFDAAGYGVIGGAFSTVYSIGRLINGRIGDKTPPWIMLSVGLFIGGIATLAIGALPPYIGVLLLWVANAYAQSMLWSSVLAVVSHIYEGPGLKRMTSIMVTAVATGNVIAIILGGFLIDALGVSFAFIVPGALNVLLGIVIILSTRGIPAPESDVEEEKRTSIWELLKNKDLCLMAIPSVFHGVMKENVTVWMVAFAAFAFGTDLSSAKYYVLLIPLIGLAGRLLYPLALRLCRERENRVSEIGFAVSLVASVLLLFTGLGLAAAVISLGIVYAATSMINTSITSIYPLSYKESGNLPSVSGILDFTSYLGAGISSAVYGVVIKYFGYVPMFVSWIVISAISIVLLLYIDNRRKKKGRV